MRYPLALLLALLPACRNRTPVLERTAVGTSLNVSATGATPEIHINPQDGGALNVQVGAARVQLPDESARAQQVEREAQ